jgi:hypothetical protein
MLEGQATDRQAGGVLAGNPRRNEALGLRSVGCSAAMGHSDRRSAAGTLQARSRSSPQVVGISPTNEGSSRERFVSAMKGAGCTVKDADEDYLSVKLSGNFQIQAIAEASLPEDPIEKLLGKVRGFSQTIL